MTKDNSQHDAAPEGATVSDEVIRHHERGWYGKFAVAFRGIKVAMRGDASFFLHFFCTVVAVILGLALGISRLDWCIVFLTVSFVLSVEMCNTAIEHLARAVTLEEHPELRDALDIAAGAVLIAAVGALIMAVLVLGVRLWELVF